MTPTSWQRVQDLINSAVDLPEKDRAGFLQEACGSDPGLLRQVEELLGSYLDEGNLIERAVESSALEVFAASALADGQRIGVYEITGVIGHGGMGTVFRALRIDDQFQQQVAIKTLNAGFAATPEALTRFRAERQILASLTHPNIARLLDGGLTTSNVPYLVMEYIEGSTIDCFAENRSLAVRARLELFRQVCSAVQYAHQNLIVHRDIKPANVMVTEDGTPKLLDFGIAKLLTPETLGQQAAFTRPAERLMTPEYASPEQILGQTITTATDVYGLGVLLYQLLTNRRPFHIENLSSANIERLICDTTPERPSAARSTALALASEKIPDDLDNIVLKALHKDPACRYASAAELSEDLQRYLNGFPVNARAISWRYRTWKFISRHKLATAAAAVFAITTITLSVGLLAQATRAKREAQTANQVADFLVSIFEDSRPDATQGHNGGARDILDRGAQRVPKELAGEPLVEARLLDILGTTYRELGVLDRAESLLRQAYTIRSQHLGADSEEAAQSLQILAEIASDRGELDLAGKDYDAVLRIYLRTKGEKSERTVEVINDIGELRFSLGDFEGAKQRYLQAIAICDEIKGPADWQTLNAKNDLQVVLADQGDYTRAEALARDVLAVEVKTMGQTNPNVALTLNNLGYILGELAHFSEAEAIFKRAYNLRRQVDGSEHPAIALSLSDLGWIARELGHYDEAQQLGERSLAMAMKLDGPSSLGTAACQGQLGLTLLAKGDFKGARQLLEASLATRMALGNPNNPELGENYDRVGLLDLAMGDFASARRNIEQGWDIRKRFFGKENDNVARSLNHLGRLLAAQADYRGAEQKYREAITIARAKFQSAHIITAEGLFGLGNTLISQGRIAEAGAHLRESLLMRRSLLPPQHPDIAKSAAALAKWTALVREEAMVK